MSLRDAWACRADAWTAFARTPGHDHWYERLNLPSFLALLPEPGRATARPRLRRGECGSRADAGLLIEVLREPVPDDEHVASRPRVAKWRRVPIFLHLRCRVAAGERER